MSENDFREVDIEKEKSREDKKIEEIEDKKEDKNNGYEEVCYICHRPESVAGKMIKIPNNICICQDCMQRTFDGMNKSGFRLDDILGPMNMNGRMPNISMINLADLQNMMPNTQKIKKKKPKEKKTVPVFDINAIPAPHKIKAKLDDYVVGQEHAKKVVSVAVYKSK